ncbi:MAG: hypothetical protein UZ21_OP11001000559 [Microgenomates bacterium OLB22]|nr:MAG: hypothetical protein UZ21_OP11001000559 [Microgenomates bacterium OLB22]
MPAHERTRSWESNSFRSELLQSVGSAPQKDYLREQALILLDKVRNGEELSDPEKAFIRDTSAAVSDIMTPLQAALMGHVDPDRIVQDQQEFISAIPTEIASALTTWSPTEDQEDTLEQLLFIQPLLHSVARDPSVSQPRVLIETLADLNTIKDIFPTETLPLVRELGRYAVEDPGLAQQIAALPLHRELNQFLLQNGEIPLFVTTEPTVDLTIPDPPRARC